MVTNRAISEWFYQIKPQARRNEPTYGRAKSYLLESLHKAVTTHNLSDCYNLLELLPKDATLDPYILFRFVMILLETVSTEKVHKNVVIYLESLMSKLDLNKPDIFIEFLSYLIKNNRIDDARELHVQRFRYISQRSHSQLPFLDTHLQCYTFLLNYCKLQERVESQDTKFDISAQGLIVNIIDQLKQTTSNHEYFVMMVVRVLLFYGFYKKAYLVVSEFQRNNPDNIAAQLLLFNLINELTRMTESQYLAESPDRPHVPICQASDPSCDHNRIKDLEDINNFPQQGEQEVFKLERYPINNDKVQILGNLRRLDATREEVLHLSTIFESEIEVLRDIMDGLEYVREIRNIARWKSLRQTLQKILASGNATLIDEATRLWRDRYQQYWSNFDFNSVFESKPAAKDVVDSVLLLLNSSFGCDENHLEGEHQATFDLSE